MLPGSPSISLTDTPQGTRELLPRDLLQQERLRRVVLDIFHSWSYQTVLPPSLENLSLLGQVRPEFIDESFRVIDSDGHLLALRPDLTIPLARLAATRLKELPRPLRLCYAATIFRRSPQQADARREIYQAGVELIGANNQDTANIECLALLCDVLRALEIPNCQIVLSHVQLSLADLVGADFQLLTSDQQLMLNQAFEGALQAGNLVHWQNQIKADAALPATLKDKLSQLCWQLTGPLGEILRQLPAGSSLQKELMLLEAVTAAYGTQPLLVDFSERPDQRFYTGLYFEVKVPGSASALAYGGRYDGLLSYFGPAEPAIGFSLDLDTVLRFTTSEQVKAKLKKRPKFSQALSDATSQGPEQIIATLQAADQQRLQDKAIVVMD